VGEVLDYAENHARLDVICITDHDDLTPGLRARDLAGRWDLHCEVVPGMEVTTLNGHVLGLFLEEPVPSMRSLPYTIEAIHAKGGVCVIPHPFSWLVFSVGRYQLESLLVQGQRELWPDALEMANPSPAGRVTRHMAQRLNRDLYKLPRVGGSDAHFQQAIGTGFTNFPGLTSADLKTAILNNTVRPATAEAASVARHTPREVATQTFRALVLHPRKLVRRVALQAMGDV
jgi:predicted metal-dependent phosphoesterase TrpH